MGWRPRKKRGEMTDMPLHALDRLLHDVEHGRFERSLSGLTALGAAVTGAEIWLEHDRASFGNRMMWLPLVFTPAAAAAGVGGVFSKRLAKTALPIASTLFRDKISELKA